MEELISIIMPVYNAERWIAQAVDSVKKQTYTNWELIIVNDGSTDNTQTVCEQYALQDSRIKVFKQSNKGPGAARNMGLSKINGEYFTMIDSDDCLSNNALLDYHKNIKSNNTDMVVAGYTFKNGESKSLTKIKCDELHIIHHKGILNIKEFERILGDGLMASNWNKLYSRKLAYIRFNEKLLMNEDVLFSLTAASASNSIVVIPDIVYVYDNKNSDSLSSHFNKDYFVSLELIDDVINNNQENELLLGIKRWIMNYVFNYLKICCRQNFSNKKKKELLREVKHSKIFRKYGTIKVADTKKRKLAIFLLKIKAFGLFIRLNDRKEKKW